MWGSFCYIPTLQGREPRLEGPKLSEATEFTTGKAELWAQAVWFWSPHSTACFSGIQEGQYWNKDLQDFSDKENAKVTADLLIAFIVLFPQPHSNVWILWTRGSQSGAELHLAMSGDFLIVTLKELGWAGYCWLRGQRPGMLRNILQCTGQQSLSAQQRIIKVVLILQRLRTPALYL